MNPVALALAVPALLPAAVQVATDGGCETKYRGSTCQPFCVALAHYCGAPAFCQLVLRSTPYGMAANCDCIGGGASNDEACCDLYILPGDAAPQFVAIGECPFFVQPLPPKPGTDQVEEEPYHTCGYNDWAFYQCRVSSGNDVTIAHCFQFIPQ